MPWELDEKHGGERTRVVSVGDLFVHLGLKIGLSPKLDGYLDGFQIPRMTSLVGPWEPQV